MGDILTNLLGWLEGGWFADWLGGLVSYCLDRLVDERGINLSVCLSLISAKLSRSDHRIPLTPEAARWKSITSSDSIIPRIFFFIILAV